MVPGRAPAVRDEGVQPLDWTRARVQRRLIRRVQAHGGEISAAPDVSRKGKASVRRSPEVQAAERLPPRVGIRGTHELSAFGSRLTEPSARTRTSWRVLTCPLALRKSGIAVKLTVDARRTTLVVSVNSGFA